MKKLFLSIATVALLASCGGEDKKEAPATTDVKTEVKADEQTSSVSAGEQLSYTVVKDSTSVLNWTGSAIGKEHFGTVDYEGKLAVNEGKLVGGELTFNMATINSNDLEGEWKAKLDGHLMAADFFNVDSFPTAKLVIKGFDGTNLNGDLTIKDVTKAILFPATVAVNETSLEGTAEFAINRTDYGVVYGSGNFFELAKDKVISDEIKFKVSIKAVK